MTSESNLARRSARVLVVDSAHRILLLRYTVDRQRRWLTPGGRVDDGEPLAVAAARELLEEIGLAVAADDLGRPVAWSSGHVEADWIQGVLRDDFFLLRVDHHQVRTAGMEELEASSYDGHRWWTMAELVATDEPVHPIGLAALVIELCAGTGRPTTGPVELPWRHDDARAPGEDGPSPVE